MYTVYIMREREREGTLSLNNSVWTEQIRPGDRIPHQKLRICSNCEVYRSECRCLDSITYTCTYTYAYNILQELNTLLLE